MCSTLLLHDNTEVKIAVYWACVSFEYIDHTIKAKRDDEVGYITSVMNTM